MYAKIFIYSRRLMGVCSLLPTWNSKFIQRECSFDSFYKVTGKADDADLRSYSDRVVEKKKERFRSLTTTFCVNTLAQVPRLTFSTVILIL